MASLAMVSCVAPRIQNASEQTQLHAEFKFADGYRFWNWVANHEARLSPDLIIVTFSGGGIRAAALAASTIEELREFTISDRPLTDNIVLVSSTSGGSIAAAYMAAHGFEQYSKFREMFLSRANTRDLLASSLGPRLFIDRSQVMQDFLEQRLEIGKLTFGELLRSNDRPYFLFNSTNLASGESFQFNQRDFDLICTNLNTLPISSGVSASSAIPFFLTDVEFKNRWDKCELGKTNYSKSQNVLNTAEEMKRLRTRYNFVHAFDNDGSIRPRPKILHLSDGGLADNLGIRALFTEVEIDLMGTISDTLKREGRDGIRQVLVLEVNARNEEANAHLNANVGSPGLLEMAFLATGIPIDQTSSLSSSYARKEFSDVVIGGAEYVRSGVLHVQIDFDALPDSEEPLRSKVKAIGMGLTLEPDELKALERASKVLLRQSPCFARFVGQSGAVAADYVLPPRKGTTGHDYDCISLTDYGAN